MGAGGAEVGAGGAEVGAGGAEVGGLIVGGLVGALKGRCTFSRRAASVTVA